MKLRSHSLKYFGLYFLKIFLPVVLLKKIFLLNVNSSKRFYGNYHCFDRIFYILKYLTYIRLYCKVKTIYPNYINIVILIMTNEKHRVSVFSISSNFIRCIIYLTQNSNIYIYSKEADIVISFFFIKILCLFTMDRISELWNISITILLLS